MERMRRTIDRATDRLWDRRVARGAWLAATNDLRRCEPDCPGADERPTPLWRVLAGFVPNDPPAKLCDAEDTDPLWRLFSLACRVTWRFGS